MYKAPQPADVREMAIKLAVREPIVAAANPFTRSAFGTWRFDDIGTREQQLESILRVWRDEIGDMYDPMPGETADQARKRPGQLPINHLPEWVRLVCQTYSKPPQRIFTLNGEVAEGNPVAEALTEFYRQASVDTVMSDVDALMFLTGNAAVIPWYDVDNAELVLHYYPSQNIRVVENHNNPKRPYATAICGTELVRDGDTMASKKAVGQIWLPGEVIYARAGAVAESEPYAGPSPVVHFFETNPTECYYVHAPGMALAGVALILINDFYSTSGHLVIMQNHGLLVLKGFPANQTLTVGPGSALNLPADTTSGAGGQGETRDAYYIQPGAQIADTTQFVDWAVGRFERSQGIPGQGFDDIAAMSGRAQVEAKAPLMERRAARFERFRRPETELLRSIMWQLKRANVAPFAGVNPADWDVRVSFPDPIAPQNIADRVASEKHDVELGLKSAADVLQSREPTRFATSGEAEEQIVDVEDDSQDGAVDTSTEKGTV